MAAINARQSALTSGAKEREKLREGDQLQLLFINHKAYREQQQQLIGTW